MCSENHHKCKRCGKTYDCYWADWVCPTMNFDENAELCEQCEIELHREYLETLTEREHADEDN